PQWGVAGLFGWLGMILLEPFLASPLRSLGLSSEGWQSYVADAILFLPGGVLGWFLAKPVNEVLGIFFRGFNRGFDWLTAAYGHIVGWSLRLCIVVLFVYGGLLFLTGYGFTHVPTGFIPSQDKGYLVVNIQLPDSASLERTAAVVKKAEKIALE